MAGSSSLWVPEFSAFLGLVSWLSKWGIVPLLPAWRRDLSLLLYEACSSSECWSRKLQIGPQAVNCYGGQELTDAGNRCRGFWRALPVLPAALVGGQQSLCLAAG